MVGTVLNGDDPTDPREPASKCFGEVSFGLQDSISGVRATDSCN